jgi:hypothetical protein
MPSNAHALVLRRAGMLLVAIGALDVAVVAYCIANEIAYSSSLNVFAVAAGVFLWRGNLLVASVVRWFSVFLLSAMTALVLAWPLVQPVELTLIELRLMAGSAVVSALAALGIVVLLFWLQRQLSGEAVLAAIRAAGRTVKPRWTACVAGGALVALLAAIIPRVMGGESGARAKAMAQAQLGADWQYHVSSLRVSKTSQETRVRASVKAWNDREVRLVSLEWRE